jgi:hypothetical protein
MFPTDSFNEEIVLILKSAEITIFFLIYYFLGSRLCDDRRHWWIFRRFLELSQRKNNPIQDDLHPGNIIIKTLNSADFVHLIFPSSSTN